MECGTKIRLHQPSKDIGNPGQFILNRRSSFRRTLEPLPSSNEPIKGMTPEKPIQPKRRQTIRSVARYSSNISQSSSNGDEVVQRNTPRGQKQLTRPLMKQQTVADCYQILPDLEDEFGDEAPSKRNSCAESQHKGATCRPDTDAAAAASSGSNVQLQEVVEQLCEPVEADRLQVGMDSKANPRTKSKEQLDDEFEAVYASMEHDIQDKMEQEETIWLAGFYVNKVKDKRRQPTKSRTVYVDCIMGWNTQDNDEDSTWMDEYMKERRTSESMPANLGRRASEPADAREEVKSKSSDTLPAIKRKSILALSRNQSV